jgi:hypothetical protein
MAFGGQGAAHILLAMFVATAVGTVAANGQTAPDQSRVIVRMDNLAGVLSADLRFAEGRAAAVFQRIGVGIEWVDEDEAVRRRIGAPLTIVLVNGEKNAGRAAAFVDALGLADRTIRRAHIFYDRVAELNVGTPRTVSSLLGDVIAHELGHLLLVPPGHSADGIMRAGLETKSWSLRTFTQAQAREIRSRLDTAAPVR